MPPALLAKAFDSKAADAAESDAALAAMAARISGDPAQLQGSLSTDPGLIAEALARYDGAPGALAELKGRYPDPRIAGKIDEVLAAMERRRGEAK